MEKDLGRINTKLLDDETEEDGGREELGRGRHKLLYAAYFFMFVSAFAVLMCQPSIQQTCLDVICDEVYGPSSSLNPRRNCSNSLVTNEAATWSQWILVAGSASALLTVGSLGVNSDVYGRLGILRVNVALMALQFVTYLLIEIAPVARSHWRAMLVASSVLYGLTGGFIVTVMQLLAFSTDISTKRERSFVFTTLEAMIGFGSLFGSELGGLVANEWGQRSVYLLALGLAAVVMTGSFCVPESLAKRDRMPKLGFFKTALRGLASIAILGKRFHLTLPTDDLQKAGAEEPGDEQAQSRRSGGKKTVNVWSLPIAALAFFSAFLGVIGSLYSVVVFYLKSIGLDSKFVGHFFAVGSAGRFLSVLLGKRLLRGQGERYELALASGMSFASALLFAGMGLPGVSLAAKFVLNFFSQSLVGIAFGVVRSFLTRHMPRSEQGVALSATAGVEIVAGFLAPLLFAQMWRLTSDWFSGFFYLAVGFLVMIASFLLAGTML